MISFDIFYGFFYAYIRGNLNVMFFVFFRVKFFLNKAVIRLLFVWRIFNDGDVLKLHEGLLDSGSLKKITVNQREQTELQNIKR